MGELLRVGQARNPRRVGRGQRAGAAHPVLPAADVEQGGFARIIEIGPCGGGIVHRTRQVRGPGKVHRVGVNHGRYGIVLKPSLVGLRRYPLKKSRTNGAVLVTSHISFDIATPDALFSGLAEPLTQEPLAQTILRIHVAHILAVLL